MKHVGAGMIIGVALAFGLGTYATAAAQRPARVRPTARMHGNEPSKATPDHMKDVDSFRGLAKKLGTTQDALESAFQTAQQANPKLTRGQFVAANVLAHNLSEKNPNITTQAILDGLKSGKSIGQTLHSLGLNDKDAKEAEERAEREAKEAERDADQAAKKAGSP